MVDIRVENMKYRIEDRDGNTLFASDDFNKAIEQLGKLGGAFLVESGGG